MDGSEQASYGDVTVRRLHPAIAGEVRGVDFSGPLDTATVAAINHPGLKRRSTGDAFTAQRTS